MIENEFCTPKVLAVAVLWCVRKGLGLQPSWPAAFLRLTEMKANEVFRIFVSMYKAYDSHTDENKLMSELPTSEIKSKHILLADLTSLHEGNSTADANGDNSKVRDTSLP
jgi:hypothetical protein